MGLIHAIILGIIQGLTEYLPVSSTAHLRIVPALLGWQDPGSAFTAVIQVGTLVAVLIYFAKDLGAAISAWARSITDREVRKTPEAKLGWAVFVGTLPIIVIALKFKAPIEHGLRSLQVIATSFIVMGIVLLIAERVGRRVRKLEEARPIDGLWVGLWQCIALIPGASRSGSTISGSLFLGFDRATAARFSFLLSVPSVLAAAVFELYTDRHELLGALGRPQDLPCLGGSACAEPDPLAGPDRVGAGARGHPRSGFNRMRTVAPPHQSPSVSI